MGQSLKITGLVASIITLLTRGVAVAQDATWKDCELGARNPDRSIAACSKILKRPSSRAHAAAFHHRALAFEAKGKLDQAISDVSAGIRLDPQPAYRWQKRGELYARQGKYQQAIADITEAIRRDPTPRAFRFHSRAEAYQGLGDLKRAVADYDEAIRLDPTRSFRFYSRANALRDVGQYDRALADYETVLKLAPTNVWALLDRGRTYARMGRSETAKSDFDKALTLDPSNAELRRAIEVEVAEIPPSTAQKRPPQSPPPQRSAPAQRAEGPSSTIARSQETPAPPMQRMEQHNSSSPKPADNGCGGFGPRVVEIVENEATRLLAGKVTFVDNTSTKESSSSAVFLQLNDTIKEVVNALERDEKQKRNAEVRERSKLLPAPGERASVTRARQQEYQAWWKGEQEREAKNRVQRAKDFYVPGGFFSPAIWRDETKRACFPKLAKYLDFQKQAIEERDRQRAERTPGQIAPSTVAPSQEAPPQALSSQLPASVQRLETQRYVPPAQTLGTGNGCGGFGPRVVEIVEQEATRLLAGKGSIPSQRAVHGILNFIAEPSNKESSSILLFRHLGEKINENFNQQRAKDFQVPGHFGPGAPVYSFSTEMWKNLPIETRRACFPQLVEYLDFQNQAIEERDRQRAEREKELKRQQAERERERQAQRAEEERQAKLPINRLKNAYSNYSIVQLCHQFRQGYAVTDINDAELQRARAAAKAIEEGAKAEDPTINPDRTFEEADQLARERLDRWQGAHSTICREALTELVNSRPGGGGTAFPTQRP